MKLRQLQEEISKASFPVSADLSKDFTSIILTLREVNFGGAAKKSAIFYQ